VQLVVTDLSMGIGGRVLFEGLDFHAQSGEMVALMGPSGSGKSTLIGGIAGQIPIRKGLVAMEPSEAAIHWVFQSTPLLGRRSGLDNVALAAELRGVPREAALEDSRGLLLNLGLVGRLEVPSYRLSGGEKQRVAVARALMSEADVILADEPTASLDPDSRAQVLRGMRRAAETGAIVILATHDRWVAEQCDQVIELLAAPAEGGQD